MSQSVFKFIQNFVDPFSESEERLIVGVSFLLIKFFKIIINFVSVLIRKNPLNQNYHIKMVNYQNQLTEALHLDLGQVFIFSSVKLDLILHKIDYFDKALLDAVEKLLLI